MKSLALLVFVSSLAGAQTFSPGSTVAPSTAPQGAGTVLDSTTSPSTAAQGNFTSPTSTINTGATPPTTGTVPANSANTNTTFGQNSLGDGTQTSNMNPNFSSPTGIPNDSTLLTPGTPSNNPVLPQAQEDPLNFSTLPDASAPSTGTGSNLGTDSSGTSNSVPFETFPGSSP